MLMVNDSAYSGVYSLNSGIVLSNYTVRAIDNASGSVAEDQFSVISRQVTVTPQADNMTAPSDNTSTTYPYLYLTMAKQAYSPGENVAFTVYTNAGIPTVTIKDPAGKVTKVDLTSGQNSTYVGIYQQKQAVVLGNYTVTATVNDNGTYTFTTTFFNMTMSNSIDNGSVDVRLVAYDPAQKAFILRADMAANSSATPEKAVNDTPAIKGLAVKSVKVIQGAEQQTSVTSHSATTSQIEVIVPANDSSMSTISQRYNISKDIDKATMSNTISADGTNAHVSLNDKVDGCWYRMSVSIPAGYTVDKIVRADGTEITNDVEIDRTTGAIVNERHQLVRR